MSTREEAYGTLAGPGAVRVERLLPGPVERVWAYLTDGEKRRTWLAPGEMELRVGGRVELRFRHADLSAEKALPERYRGYEEGHVMHGTVTQCEPPRLLGYTWGDGAEDSEVTFELEPRGDDVFLVITQRRLRSRAGMASVAAGWHAHIGILIDHLEGREPRGFWTAHDHAEAEYARRFADAPVSAGVTP
jgi:uncharacterized protein YndB with AHSA1/START domain